MRPGAVLLRKFATTKEPVPFQEILPLKLKSYVSGKGDHTSELKCVHEMTILMACLKLNEFGEEFCSKEIQSFQQCFQQSTKMKAKRKEQAAKGILIPGERQLSHKQVNKLLSRYPSI